MRSLCDVQIKMSAKQVRFRSGSSEKKFGLQYKFGFSEGKKKAPGNFSSTCGTPRGTHVLIPLPQLQEHVIEVWVLCTGPNTHTHMITPAPYGCDHPYRHKLPWEHGHRIRSWFPSFLYRYCQNSVSLVIPFFSLLVSLTTG